MVISIIIQVLLGLGFLMFGYQKFVSEDLKKGFIHFGYNDAFRIFTGAFEMIAAVLVLIGIIYQPLATIGAIMLVFAMLGALLTHIKIKDSVQNKLMPIILLIMAAVVTTMNWTALF